MAKTSPTNQIVFDDKRHNLEEMTMELVREKAEQFVLDLIAGKLFH
jgi:Holliday junction resolvasome RuvABC ATP-dependent DNA helicase subunit